LRFFFYGTLLDADVRRAVLGPYAPRRVEAATLRGWRRVGVRGRTYPILTADPAAEVDGLLARGLNDAARRRLERYEDSDLYEMTEVQIVPAVGARPLSALVFVAKASALRLGAREWDLALWLRREKRRFLLTLRRRAVS
jgi:hypothetical protein